jgi:hypothetical protein
MKDHEFHRLKSEADRFYKEKDPERETAITLARHLIIAVETYEFDKVGPHMPDGPPDDFCVDWDEVLDYTEKVKTLIEEFKKIEPRVKT